MIKRIRVRQLILMIVDSLCVIFSAYGALLLCYNGPIPEEFTSQLLVMLVLW